MKGMWYRERKVVRRRKMGKWRIVMHGRVVIYMRAWRIRVWRLAWVCVDEWQPWGVAMHARFPCM